MASATSAGKVITWLTVSLSRSIRTSFGPPGRVRWNFGLPVSSTHNRSAGSTTTLCTETNACSSSCPDGEFHCWSGYGTSRRSADPAPPAEAPSRSSTTVAGTSSPHRGKLTKMRPRCETLTPVGIGPSKA